MLKIINLDIHNERALKEVNEIFKRTWNDSIEESLKKHTGYEGFQCILLQIEEKTIGFAYGYSSVPGQYYHDLLHRHLSPQDYESYLTDCFEFVELAVLPEYRKKGFGARLTNCLLN